MFVNCCLIVSYGLLWKAKGRKNDGNYIQLDPEPLDLLILSTCLFTRVKKYIIASFFAEYFRMVTYQKSVASAEEKITCPDKQS